MSLSTSLSYVPKKTWIAIIALFSTIILVGVIAIIVYNVNQAQKMKLTFVQGVVTLVDENGGTSVILQNKRFSTGESLRTGMMSSASVAIDSKRNISLGENTTAVFTDEGKNTTINLTSGRLFFSLNEPLSGSETFTITTATMSIEVTDASGYVLCDVNGNDQIIVTTGHVHVDLFNSKTGETKEMFVYAGQQMTTYVYNERTHDSIQLGLGDADMMDLPAFVFGRICDNEELFAQVVEETGWSATTIRALDRGASAIESNAATVTTDN